MEHPETPSTTNQQAAVKKEENDSPIERATEHKEEGTEHFRASRWTEALVAYRTALACLPPRPAPPPPAAPSRDDDPDEFLENENKGKGKAKEEETNDEAAHIALSSPAVSEADKEISRLRAVLNANIGACHVKLGDHKEAVKACSDAILDDPSYIKARERRAACNEIIDSWSSLTSTEEDYNALLSLPITAKQQVEIRRKLQVLKPRLAAAQKRETDEMLSKLKGMGNSILGNFGLSTDNFKFEPNGSGGYSLNFQR